MELSKVDILQLMLLSAFISFFWMCVVISAPLSSGETEKVLYTNSASLPQAEEPETSEYETEDSTESVTFQIFNVHAEIPISTDYGDARDGSMEQICVSMLEGSYVADLGMEYVFGADGSFSGFFDDADTSVTGYSYEIIVLDDTSLVNIYNKEKTAMVSYELILSRQSVALYYPAADLKIILK